MSTTLTREELDTLAQSIQDQPFDCPFTIAPDGTLSDVDHLYAPTVYHDDATDIMIDGAGWSALTGLTGQYSYSGAVMHPSEYVGRGIAEHLAYLAADEPCTFVLVVCEVLPEDDADAGADDPEPAGWCILMRDRARVDVDS